MIGTMNINGPVSSFSNASIELRGTGDFDLDVIEPPVPGTEHVLYIAITPGATSVSSALLIGATILQVRRNGLSLTVTTGTPGNQEFKFTSGTGTIATDTNVPYESGEQPIYVLYSS